MGIQPCRIGAVGIATPPYTIDQQNVDQLLTEHYSDTLTQRSLDVMHRILEHPSIRTRYLSVENETELLALKDEDPDERMERFTQWGIELSKTALNQALQRANIEKRDITHLIVNTCTGYLCPGIATYLIEECGLSESVFSYDLVGAGCGGALPNMQLASAITSSNPNAIVASIAFEVCTATYQMGNDISLIVSNAIFGDGAGAAIIWSRPSGPHLIDTVSHFLPKLRDDVRYVYRDGQLHNRLSPQLPKIIGKTVPPVINQLLSRNGLSTRNITHWAMHPGGDKMISTLQNKLGLSDEQLAVTRSILREYGNMSSPTVLFELHRIHDTNPQPGDWGIIVGFGAGLSIHASLIKW